MKGACVRMGRCRAHFTSRPDPVHRHGCRLSETIRARIRDGRKGDLASIQRSEARMTGLEPRGQSAPGSLWRDRPEQRGSCRRNCCSKRIYGNQAVTSASRFYQDFRLFATNSLKEVLIRISTVKLQAWSGQSSEPAKDLGAQVRGSNTDSIARDRWPGGAGSASVHAGLEQADVERCHPG